MRNVLITGGAGFIGSHIAIRLIEKGYRVTILDNLSKQIHGDSPEGSYTYSLIKDKVKFIRGDVCNSSDWESAVIDQDAVIHLAAETGTGQSMYQIAKYTDVNVKGTAILLDTLSKIKTPVKKIVLSSSRAVYGEGKYSCVEHGTVYPDIRLEKDMSAGDFNVKCPICHQTAQVQATDEKARMHPTSIYGLTKQVQEQMLLLTAKALDVSAVVFRYQNVYGPGQSLKNPYTGILSIFSTALRNGDDINIFEDGNESRDFVYISDVVEATILGLESNNADNKVFNVGSGIPTTVFKVASTLKEILNSRSAVKISGNFRIGDIRSNFADTTRAKEELSFSTRIDFETGIAKFINWVMAQKIIDDGSYDNSLKEMESKGLFKLGNNKQ